MLFTVLFSLFGCKNQKENKAEIPPTVTTVETTEWHNIAVWGKQADIVETYVTKGKQIGIVGKLTHRT